MIDEEVDIAVHPPNYHPLDPFAKGRLITRRVGDVLELVEHDENILLDCGFLWDVFANQKVFAPWCQLISPEKALEIKSNFYVADGVSLLDLNIPSNRPRIGASYPMCQHYSMLLTIGSRVLEYIIGAYRPSINAMEATLRA